MRGREGEKEGDKKEEGEREGVRGRESEREKRRAKEIYMYRERGWRKVSGERRRNRDFKRGLMKSFHTTVLHGQTC